MPDNRNEKVVILPKVGSPDTTLSFGKKSKIPTFGYINSHLCVLKLDHKLIQFVHGRIRREKTMDPSRKRRHGSKGHFSMCSLPGGTGNGASILQSAGGLRQSRATSYMRPVGIVIKIFPTDHCKPNGLLISPIQY